MNGTACGDLQVHHEGLQKQQSHARKYNLLISNFSPSLRAQFGDTIEGKSRKRQRLHSPIAPDAIFQLTAIRLDIGPSVRWSPTHFS